MFNAYNYIQCDVSENCFTVVLIYCNNCSIGTKFYIIMFVIMLNINMVYLNCSMVKVKVIRLMFMYFNTFQMYVQSIVALLSHTCCLQANKKKFMHNDNLKRLL